jgi:thioredoxin 1
MFVFIAVEKMDLNLNNIEALAVEIDETGFAAEVLESERPVLVTFMASWSQPCQMLRPVLDEVAAACAGSVKVVKVMTDECDLNPGLCLDYEIRSLPTLLYFVAGRECARFVGTANKEAIIAKLKH